MRLTVPALMIAAALGGAWARAALPPPETDAPGSAPAASAPSAAREGLALRLAELGAPPLPGLAAAPGEDGLWRVRGRAPLPGGAAAGWPAPLYAEARPLCDAGLERPACWAVARLEIDGRPGAVR